MSRATYAMCAEAGGDPEADSSTTGPAGSGPAHTPTAARLVCRHCAETLRLQVVDLDRAGRPVHLWCGSTIPTAQCRATRGRHELVELDGVSLAYATRDVAAELERYNRWPEPDPLWQLTLDDLALNALADAFEAGRPVHYRGSVEQCQGWRVTQLDRCDIDCCQRRQAVVWARGPHEASGMLRHVDARHLIVS